MQGSILWMAPEVARGKGYSAKVDIWSTGCLILEMLTGNLPWHKAQGNIIFLLGKGNAPPIPTNLTAFSTEFLNLTFTIEADKRPTASELLDNPYTDIDPLSVDFKQWSETAIQLKADGGSTSEDISPLTEGDEELSDDDSETIEDINDFNVFNQPNVDFSTTFSGATEIESKLDDGPAKNVEDDSAEDDLYGWTQSLGPEEARNLQELLNLGKRL